MSRMVGRYGAAFLMRLLNSNNFTTSAALTEVCPLLGAILVLFYNHQRISFTVRRTT